MSRRVRNGLFSGYAPYGYENYRENGRGLVRVNEERAANVRRAFELYGYHRHTLDSLVAKLSEEGRRFSAGQSYFNRSKLHQMLTDRSYLGEVRYRDKWYPGTHPAIVERALFERVQTLLGVKIYASHESVYGSGLVTCAHCGRPLVCEIKTKPTRDGEREHRYYRCTRYTAKGHPRDRVNEKDFDQTMLGLFRKLRVEDPKIRHWVENVIRAKANSAMQESTRHLQEVQRRAGQLDKDRNALLTLADARRDHGGNLRAQRPGTPGRGGAGGIAARGPGSAEVGNR